MVQMTFVAANKVLETLDEKLSGAALKKQFKAILDRLEVNYESTKKINVATKFDDVKTIIDYLNEKAGTKYRETTRKTQTLVAALFRDGYALSDFQHVIDVKCAEWLGTGFQKHLNPDTLFNASKFEKYVNQKPVKPKVLEGSTTPDWYDPDYKNSTTDKQQAELDRIKRQALERMK